MTLQLLRLLGLMLSMLMLLLLAWTPHQPWVLLLLLMLLLLLLLLLLLEVLLQQCRNRRRRPTTTHRPRRVHHGLLTGLLRHLHPHSTHAMPHAHRVRGSHYRLLRGRPVAGHVALANILLCSSSSGSGSEQLLLPDHGDAGHSRW